MADQNINVVKSGGEFKNQQGVNASYQMDENGNIRLNNLPHSTLDSEQWKVGFFDEPWSMESKVTKTAGSACVGTFNGSLIRVVDQTYGGGALMKGSLMFLFLVITFYIYGSRTSRGKMKPSSSYGAWMLGSHIFGLLIGRFG
jgi:hypothetical protein